MINGPGRDANLNPALIINDRTRIAMTSVIMTRAEARAQGLKRFKSAFVCPKCETQIRLTNGGCAECTRRYSLEWKQNNRERARSLSRVWKLENPDAAKQWHVDNREKSRAACRRYYESNQGAMQARSREWGRNNPEMVAANTQKRRCRVVSAPGAHTAAETKALLAKQNHLCAYCGADLRKAKKHLDHITPLSKGGSNDIRNLQWLCASCNLSKGARDPIEFAQMRGLLI